MPPTLVRVGRLGLTQELSGGSRDRLGFVGLTYRCPENELLPPWSGLALEHQRLS